MIWRKSKSKELKIFRKDAVIWWGEQVHGGKDIAIISAAVGVAPSTQV